jgi:hypothetical protein
VAYHLRKVFSKMMPSLGELSWHHSASKEASMINVVRN